MIAKRPVYKYRERIWWRSFCLIPRRISTEGYTYWVWLEHCEKSKCFLGWGLFGPEWCSLESTERRLTEELKLKVGIKW
jgi:hypothetical protein